VDHWDSNSKLRAPESDPLRKWADMEGKSPTMSEDLYLSQAPRKPSSLNIVAFFAASTKLVAGIVHAWLSDSR
jgi:hypothetical protein